MRFVSGILTKYLYFIAVDATDNITRETGLTTFTVYRSRNGAAAVAMTTPTIIEISAANMPGVYALLLDEDMTITTDSHSEEMTFHITHAGMALLSETIELYNPAQLVSDVWDEVLTGATHNVPTSSGRRLRGLQDFQGYENGSIWIDTINGDSGTTEFENGTVENPVLTLADAVTLNASLGFNRFTIFNGSTITLVSSFVNYNFFGTSWVLALGNQDIGGTRFEGSAVSGIGTGAEAVFNNCDIGDISIDHIHTIDCALSGDIIITATGDQHFANSHSAIAGSATPSIDVGAGVANSNINFRNYSGGMEFKNLGQSGVDLVSIEGDGQVILNANCIGGQINIRGNFELTDNSSTPFTIIIDGARFDAPRQVDLVWDEPLTGATHNVSTSSGRRLRQIQSGAYQNASIWIDTINGIAGTDPYEHGTVDNPVDNIADALTLAISVGLTRFEVAPGSSITLVATVAGYIFNGFGWILILGGQDVSGTIFIGAHTDGICTATVEPDFTQCQIGDVTVPPCHFRLSDLNGTIIAGAAGDFFFDQCHSAIAGIGSPMFDFGNLVGDTNLNFRHYSGGIQLERMGDAGVDTMSLEGNGQLIEGTCTGGIVAIRGNFTTTNITNLTLLDDARFDINKIFDTQMVEDYAADGAPVTLAQILYLIQQTIGDFSIVGTVLTAKKLDGVTPAATYTLDDAVNPTSRTRAT